MILRGLQDSAGTGRSANAAAEVDLGSGRHTNHLDDSSSTVDGQALLREALSAALCLAGVREPELHSLLDAMVPDISKCLAYFCTLLGTVQSEDSMNIEL